MTARTDERDAEVHRATDVDHGLEPESHGDGYDTVRQEATAESGTLPQSEPPVTQIDETTEFVRPAPVEDEKPRSRLGAAAPQRLGGSATTATGIWIGLVLAAAGLAAIVYTWREVAALTNVAEQMPYLVSGGIAGLVLIIAGATVVDVTVRRRDSKERTEQLAQMTQALAEVRELLESEQSERRAE
ncbi:hypothetical protein [Haloechinothrix halophila]|uniref:hypothetical protein n=1 Tax=Haloechinothrix halophila TaxID=1069073 RepID=UPI00055447C4|nr:hypothetical protein [Haloechinothrix halophila]